MANQDLSRSPKHALGRGPVAASSAAVCYFTISNPSEAPRGGPGGILDRLVGQIQAGAKQAEKTPSLMNATAYYAQVEVLIEKLLPKRLGEDWSRFFAIENITPGYLNLTHRQYTTWRSQPLTQPTHHDRIVTAFNTLLGDKYVKSKAPLFISGTKGYYDLLQKGLLVEHPVDGPIINEIPLLKLVPKVEPIDWPREHIDAFSALLRNLEEQKQIQLKQKQKARVDGTSQVYVISVPRDPKSIEEAQKHFQGLRSIPGAVLTRKKKGSVKYEIEIPSASKETLLELYRSGQLSRIVGSAVYSIEQVMPEDAGDDSGPTLNYSTEQVPSIADMYYFMAWHSRELEPRGAMTMARESLRLLLTVISSPWRSLSTSLSRFYFVPVLLAETPSLLWSSGDSVAKRATKRALLNAFVYWPLFSSVITVLLSIVLTGHMDFGVILWATSSAAIMAMVGSLVCGPLFSIMGVGAGGVFFAIAFGVTQVLLAQWAKEGLDGLAHLASANDRIANPMRAHEFVAVVNGIIGVAAVEINTIGRRIAALMFPSLAIITTAWLMGNPRSDDNNDGENRAWRKVVGTVLGVLAGGGIGMVQGLFALLRHSMDPRLAFCIAATVVGIPAYSLCVWLRTKDKKQAVLYGLFYGVVGALLWGLTMASRGTIPGLFVNGLGTAFFHACYFTLSYAIGFAIGGRWAAFVAAASEGVIGFVVFNILLILKH